MLLTDSVFVLAVCHKVLLFYSISVRYPAVYESMWNLDVFKAHLSLHYSELHVLCAVLFRVIGVSQDLKPAYTGSMTIYVQVCTTVQISMCFCCCNLRISFWNDRLQSVLMSVLSLSCNINNWYINWSFLLQDAKGNFVRRWIQRQLNFGKIIIQRYLVNAGFDS